MSRRTACVSLDSFMTLPDWTAGILSQVQAFLEWDAVATMVQVIVGTAVAGMILAMFMRVFHRG